MNSDFGDPAPIHAFDDKVSATASDLLTFSWNSAKQRKDKAANRLISIFRDAQA
jgi:hypothetical protein